MGILQIVLSQSEATQTIANPNTTFINEFNVNMTHNIPINSINLIGYYIINNTVQTDALFCEALRVHIPWLESASQITTGVATNVTNKANDEYNTDLSGASDKSIILPNRERFEQESNINYQFKISKSMIPSQFTVKVTNALNGQPYLNMRYMVLYFHFDSNRLF